MPEGLVVKVINCVSCGKRLMDACIVEGIVQVKCTKCGVINKIEASKEINARPPRGAVHS